MHSCMVFQHPPCEGSVCSLTRLACCCWLCWSRGSRFDPTASLCTPSRTRKRARRSPRTRYEYEVSSSIPIRTDKPFSELVAFSQLFTRNRHQPSAIHHRPPTTDHRLPSPITHTFSFTLSLSFSLVLLDSSDITRLSNVRFTHRLTYRELVANQLGKKINYFQYIEKIHKLIKMIVHFSFNH